MNIHVTIDNEEAQKRFLDIIKYIGKGQVSSDSPDDDTVVIGVAMDKRDVCLIKLNQDEQFKTLVKHFYDLFDFDDGYMVLPLQAYSLGQLFDQLHLGQLNDIKYGSMEEAGIDVSEGFSSLDKETYERALAIHHASLAKGGKADLLSEAYYELLSLATYKVPESRRLVATMKYVEQLHEAIERVRSEAKKEKIDGFMNKMLEAIKKDMEALGGLEPEDETAPPNSPLH